MISHSVDRDPSDSSFQIQFEKVMLEILQENHPNWRPVDWMEVSIDLGLPTVWQRAKPDAVWKDENGIIIIAECYARVDKLKAGHRRKLAMDVLKLLSLRRAAADPKSLRGLLIVPEELDGQLQANDWFSEAIRQAVEVISIRLSDDQSHKLRKAVESQASGQARTKKTGGKLSHG